TRSLRVKFQEMERKEEPGQHCVVISLMSSVKQYAKHNNTQEVKATPTQKFKYSSSTQTEDITTDTGNKNKIQQAQHQRGRRGSYYEYHLTCMETAQQCHKFRQGRLLEGLERGAEFPVIHLSLPVNNVLPPSILPHDALGDTTVLQQGVYDELVRWYPEMQEPPPSTPRQKNNPKCHILIGFKTIQGMEVSEDIEYRWREWTGALYIYCNISEELGLSHVTFYRKRGNTHPSMFTYLVVAQLDSVTQTNSLHLLDFVYRMRIRRGSGYISVYKELNRMSDDDDGNSSNALYTYEDEENGNHFLTVND
ncbi:unnamed protein product, partial [Meganyctiphanes norvegica]